VSPSRPAVPSASFAAACPADEDEDEDAAAAAALQNLQPMQPQPPCVLVDHVAAPEAIRAAHDAGAVRGAVGALGTAAVADAVAPMAADATPLLHIRDAAKAGASPDSDNALAGQRQPAGAAAGA